MGKLDDFINSLEGQENIDPLEVASKMLELHNEEIGIHAAKIEELTGVVAEKDNSLADLNTALTAQKAKNYDLAMQIPGVKTPTAHEEHEDATTITIDDLFKE